MFRIRTQETGLLEAITLGQNATIGSIFQHLLARDTRVGCRHTVLCGPEGCGKSHMLAVLESKVTQSPDLVSTYQVVRLPESRHRILNFSGFLTLILECLEEKSPDGETRDSKVLLQHLRSHTQQVGKTLLLVLENLEGLCRDQFKSARDLSAFLSFLREESWCIMLASTCSTEGPSGLPSALLKNVTVFRIQNLSCEDFVRLANPEANPAASARRGASLDVLRHFHKLCGGRPRIATLLQDILSSENPEEPWLLFTRLLDRMTPRLRAHLAALAPQERAVLEVLALLQGDDRSPSALSAKLRMKQGQLSSLLRRLSEAGHICNRILDTDRRARRYAFQDPLLELWLISGSTPHNQRRLQRQITLLCTLPAAPQQRPNTPAQPSARPGARGYLANEAFFLADLEDMTLQWCRERGGEFRELEAFLTEKNLTPAYRAWAAFRAEKISALPPPAIVTERAAQRLRCASLWSDIDNFAAARKELDAARKELGEEGLGDTALAGIVLNDLAVLLQNCDLPAEAEPLIQRACEILATDRSAAGMRSPSLGTALRNYHAILRRLGWDEEQAFATVAEIEQRA